MLDMVFYNYFIKFGRDLGDLLRSLVEDDPCGVARGAEEAIVGLLLGRIAYERSSARH